MDVDLVIIMIHVTIPNDKSIDISIFVKDWAGVIAGVSS